MKKTAEIMRHDFHGDALDVVWLPDHSDVGVSLRRICDTFPVDFSSQVKRLAREAAKGTWWACVVKMTVHDSTGREQEMLILPRRSIPMFAATLSLGSVREDLRAGITAKLARYQDECAEALADHFMGKRAATGAEEPLDVEGLDELVDELRAFVPGGSAITRELVLHDLLKRAVDQERERLRLLFGRGTSRATPPVAAPVPAASRHRRRDPVLAAYFRHLIDVWMAEDPSRSQAELARLAGLSGAQISELRNAGRGVGIHTLRVLAPLLGTTVERALDEAPRWVASRT